MQGIIKGFNTASIKKDDRFFALALKIKLQSDQIQLFYLQPLELFDLLQILMSRLAIITQRLSSQGEAYKQTLVTASESLLANVTTIEMSEIEQPDAARRIVSLTLKPGETYFSLIIELQNEQIAMLKIDDNQVGTLVLGIQNAIQNAKDESLNTYINSFVDHIVLFATDMTNMPKIDYQQFNHAAWKHNMFSHCLAILYCFDTENGKQILSGAVIKTSTEHRSGREEVIARLLIEHSPKLKIFADQYPLSQILTRVIPVPQNKVASLEDCLLPLRVFCQEMKPQMDAAC